MKLASVLLSIPVLALALTGARDAAACGGCFVPEEESTQVTGHKMLVSISMQETTLWDQIEYVGNPASFAWVLPTRGIVEIGLSSDLLFAFAGDMTRVDIAPPPLNCPSPPWCYDSYAEEDGAFGSTGAGGQSADGGVTVLAQEVVGPYETVQLSSDDPAALKDWLVSHNYAVPADIAAVVDTYVNEGFNFLALKLVPGEGIESMRPVRVTTPGAGIGLPLRMVAAGTGAVTPITLWVVGEGRYETANFPNFTIDPVDLVWNWDTSSSNYSSLKTNAFDASGGLGWLTEAARPISRWDLESPMTSVADGLPEQSGYLDDSGVSPYVQVIEDMDKLFGKLDQGSVWLSRMHAELPRVALASDLELGAAMSQTNVENRMQATKWTGTFPSCPVYPPCDDATSGGGGQGSSGDGDDPIEVGGGSSCSVGTGAGAPAMAAFIGLALSLAMARRRKGR